MLAARCTSRAPFSAQRCPTVAKAARSELSRRDVMCILAVVPSIVVGRPALALIPDDDDEELVAKAKANRQERVRQDKEAQREYVSAQGYRDRSIESAIVPVQTGVYKMARAGEQLESGDLAAASATLGESWVSEFETACSELSLKEESKTLVPQMITSIKDTAAACSAGDSTKAKVTFVALVEAVEQWAVGAGVSSSIKGL